MNKKDLEEIENFSYSLSISGYTEEEIRLGKLIYNLVQEYKDVLQIEVEHHKINAELLKQLKNKDMIIKIRGKK